MLFDRIISKDIDGGLKMSVQKRKMEYIADGTRGYIQMYREHINTIVSRSDQLGKMDRIVVRLYFIDGYTLDQIAAVAGVSPAQMSRRFKRLLKRIRSCEFAGYLHIHTRLSRFERRIGRDYFIRGISMRRISLDTGCSLYRIRQIVAGIRSRISG